MPFFCRFWFLQNAKINIGFFCKKWKNFENGIVYWTIFSFLAHNVLSAESTLLDGDCKYMVGKKYRKSNFLTWYVCLEFDQKKILNWGFHIVAQLYYTNYVKLQDLFKFSNALHSGPENSKKSRQKKIMKSNKSKIVLWNCIFGSFKLFPSSKSDFWPFWLK